MWRCCGKCSFDQRFPRDIRDSPYITLMYTIYTKHRHYSNLSLPFIHLYTIHIHILHIHLIYTSIRHTIPITLQLPSCQSHSTHPTYKYIRHRSYTENLSSHILFISYKHSSLVTHPIHTKSTLNPSMAHSKGCI